MLNRDGARGGDDPPDRPPLSERVLAWTGRDDPACSASKWLAFARLLLLLVAVESWESLHYWRTQPAYPLHLALSLLLSACAVAGWFPRLTRPAAGAATAAMLVHNVSAFPLNANHHHLQLLCLGLVASFDGARHAERAVLLGGLRWLPVLGLAWAGLQKLLYGYYFRGEFFAYAISQHARFSDLFRLLMPADEWTRVRALEFAEGAGPYRVEAPLFVAVSNISYLAELALPPLLLFRRTRVLGVWATLGYLVAIEAGARELFFGLLMLGLLLLFFERDVNRRVLPWLVALLLWMLLVSFGVLPRWYFT